LLDTASPMPSKAAANEAHVTIVQRSSKLEVLWVHTS
jgi:hypothetical protein